MPAAWQGDSRSSTSTDELWLAPAQAIPARQPDVATVHATATVVPDSHTQLAQALLLALAISAVAHMLMYIQQRTGLSTQQQAEQERLPSKQQQEVPSADQQKSLQAHLNTEGILPRQAKKQVQDQDAVAPCRQLWLQKDDTKQQLAGDTAPQDTMPAQLQLLLDQPSLQQLHAERPEPKAAHATEVPAPLLLSHQEWLSVHQREFTHLKEQLQQQAQELQELQHSMSAAIALQELKLQDRESQLHAEAASLHELQQHNALRKQVLAREHRLLLQQKQEFTTDILLQRAKLELQHNHLQDQQRRLAVQQQELRIGQRELQDQWYRFEQERTAWQIQQLAGWHPQL
jgi:glucan-binding YG repeat protein